MRYESLMQELGMTAPGFSLPDATTGRVCALDDFAGAKGLVVAFLCNHCPFVMHVLPEFVKFAAEYKARGVATVAISANDVETHPDDGPAQMAELAKARDFSFPYLYDESQDVASAYGAACTPDFFLYDGERRLYYRGRFDASRPGTPHTVANNIAVTGDEMRAAVDALLAGKPAPEKQWPSMGCSLKWKPGKAPAWA